MAKEELIEEEIEAVEEEVKQPVKKTKKPAKAEAAGGTYPACHPSIRSLSRAFESIGEPVPDEAKIAALAKANRIDPSFAFKEFAMLKLLQTGKLKRA